MESVAPFIFGVNGYYHGPHEFYKCSRLEVHLKNHEPTEAFDIVYYDLGDDRSTTQGKFQTVNGLPWALIIGSAWSHPRENIDITDAYPQFRPFVEVQAIKIPHGLTISDQ